MIQDTERGKPNLSVWRSWFIQLRCTRSLQKVDFSCDKQWLWNYIHRHKNLFPLNKPVVLLCSHRNLRRVLIAMVTNMFIKMMIGYDPMFSVMEKKLARMFSKIYSSSLRHAANNWYIKCRITDVHFLFLEKILPSLKQLIFFNF